MSHTGIMDTVREETVERMRGEELVLLVQDTTSLDYSEHPGTSGLGPLETRGRQGMFVHSSLAVSSSGVPLGVLEQQVWVRNPATVGQRAKRRQRAFEDKESYKWVKGLPSSSTVGQGVQYVTVSDAESHIYEFLDSVLAAGQDFIVRAVEGRSTTLDGQALFAAVAAQPVQQRYSLTVKPHPDGEPRQAELELRFSSLTLKRPPHARHAQRATLTVSVVDVWEPSPPPDTEPIHWLLLTSLAVQTVLQARQIVVWYSFRWLVERFHFVLKSGCKLEQRQLREELALERLLAVFNLVAWKLLWLTYQARLSPDAPCSVALSTTQWQALFAFVHHSPVASDTPPSLHQAVRWIAQLGGFLARPGDGEPGLKVLWRGWSRLQDIAQAWLIFHPLPLVGND